MVVALIHHICADASHYAHCRIEVVFGHSKMWCEFVWCYAFIWHCFSLMVETFIVSSRFI